ncbi:hypothetical protein [Vacuolonema iberomarrocanum]|nr:hypothetical protein [filamentous cyanobacterium LEGE 07170]
MRVRISEKEDWGDRPPVMSNGGQAAGKAIGALASAQTQSTDYPKL